MTVREGKRGGEGAGRQYGRTGLKKGRRKTEGGNGRRDRRAGFPEWLKARGIGYYGVPGGCVCGLSVRWNRELHGCCSKTEVLEQPQL
jgi:hypothetical protein